MTRLDSARAFQSVALAALCVFAVHANAEPTKDEYNETIEQTFPLAAGGTFTLDNRNGAIEVSTWDKEEVHIVAEKRLRLDGSGGWWLSRLLGLKRTEVKTDADAKALLAELTIEFSGDEKGRVVKTHYPETSNVNCSVKYKITAPRKMKVNLDTVNGSVRVSGVEGETVAATTSGSVDVENVVGRVHAVSTNGRVELEGISGPIVAKTTNGAVSVRLSSAARVEDVEMHSVNGSVRLFVPSNAAFELSARTVNGSVQCNLPLASVTQQTRKKIEGVVGAAGPRVEVSTTNGSVQIGPLS